jgi:hypothetical protein
VVCWFRTRASPGVFLPMVGLRDEAEEYQESLARRTQILRSEQVAEGLLPVAIWLMLSLSTS